ncbi:MAG: hypothetical protein LKK17_04055 [Bifidobacterium breve]|jgi:hypothetical protein|nr:hypothetical protein [Bifidobacterium breve]MCI2130453.1 hypothetical protein [Bifidobacterium breve]
MRSEADDGRPETSPDTRARRNSPNKDSSSKNCPTHRCQSIAARRFRHGNNAAGRHSGTMQPVDAEDADADAVETADPVPGGQSEV